MTPPKIVPQNTIGSGDAFTAGLTVHYINTSNMKEAVEFAISTAVKNAEIIRPGRIK